MLLFYKCMAYNRKSLRKTNAIIIFTKQQRKPQNFFSDSSQYFLSIGWWKVSAFHFPDKKTKVRSVSQPGQPVVAPALDFRFADFHLMCRNHRQRASTRSGIPKGKVYHSDKGLPALAVRVSYFPL